MIYLITVNYQSRDLIARLLASVELSSSEYQFIIVNNSPEDQAVQTLAGDRVHLLKAGQNLGFGRGCNLALQWVYERDPGAIAWLINPDTLLPKGMLETATQFCLNHPELSILGTVILEPDGAVWFAGGEFNPMTGRIVAQTDDRPLTAAVYQETPWVTGCSLLLNLRNFPICPYFDQEFFLYYEDFDFCRRYAQQSHRIGVTQHIQVIHAPSSITSRHPALKVQHSTYSYLLALERHTSRWVLGYRLGRILGRALRVSMTEPETAIAIIKGVVRYGKRVSGFGQPNLY
ncbi:MAG: hypothetical protein OHK0047_04730 [Leptolyngbyaceae cyanobacterium]